MTIVVVAGPQSREFLLATLDYKLTQAQTRRDYYRAAADQAALDGAPVMEELALAREAPQIDLGGVVSTVLTRLRRLLHRTPPARVAAHQPLPVVDVEACPTCRVRTPHTHRDPTTGRYTRREQ